MITCSAPVESTAWLSWLIRPWLGSSGSTTRLDEVTETCWPPVAPTIWPALLRQVRPRSSLKTYPVSWLDRPPELHMTALLPSRHVNAACRRPLGAYVRPCRYMLRVVLTTPFVDVHDPVLADHFPSRCQALPSYSASSLVPLPELPVRKLSWSV